MMNNEFTKWFLICVRYKYADFSGRARRKEFWMYYLVWQILDIIGTRIEMFLIPTRLNVPIVVPTLALGLLIPCISVTARRLHDVGKSGLWQLLCVPPIVCGLVFMQYATLEDVGKSGWLMLFVSILCILYFWYLLVKDSQPDTNKWGPNPKIADVEWYRKQAEQGDTGAQFALGWMYEHGIDTPKDIRKAVEWYRPAAAQGNKNAQNALDRLK